MEPVLTLKVKDHRLKAMLLTLKVIIQKQKLMNLILKVLELLLKIPPKLMLMDLNILEDLMLKVLVLNLVVQLPTQKDI